MSEGGPVAGIDSYGHGGEVIERYLQILGPTPEDLEELFLLDGIRLFLEREEDGTALESSGWTPTRRKWIHAHCVKTIALPHWKEVVETELRKESDQDFYHAVLGAQIIKFDTYEACHQRIRGKGKNAWYHLMTSTDSGRIDRSLELALEMLPLAQIATGPKNELGLGPEFAANNDLGYVLQELHRFPGKGWKLIQAGLKDPVVRNRNQAMRALDAWEPTQRTPEILTEIRHALAIEPDEGVQEKMEHFLAGKRLE
jgi:hypothetical protein